MLHIKVPATTANMGSGFDCIGMALSLYNNVYIESCEEKLIIDVKNKQNQEIPTDSSNLIYKSIVSFYEQFGIKNQLPNIKITQEDYIPIARGLGSSAACIVSGLLAANELSGLKLSIDELANIAAKIEMHPDNVAPAIFGGIVFGVMTNSGLQYIKLDNENIRKLKFAVIIPEFPLLTEEARGVLPKQISLKQGVFNASRTALMAAAFSTGQFEKLSVAMDDCFHQPYRSQIIKNMNNIFNSAKQNNAIGVFLSGAGPTIIAVTEDDKFVTNINKYLQTLDEKWNAAFIEPDFVGATVTCL